MKPLFCGTGVLLVLLMAGLMSGLAGASSDDETATIKKVMDVLHKPKNGPLNTVKAALKTDSPDWAAVQKQAKVLAKFGAALPKNDPPAGEKADFEKLAKAYASAAKTLEETAEKEDLKGARAALKKITSSCMPCHTSHKEK
jgi:cytochrome c556